MEDGSIVVFADLGCPWAHLAIHRLHETRAKLGLDDAVRFDVRAFPLELFNTKPTPKLTLDAEIPVAGALDPAAGWQLWQGPEHAYPVTMLPPMEAVEAAKEQGLRASEELDRALRDAFFGHSRTISMRHVIAEIAESCQHVHVGKLMDALDDGRARQRVMQQAGVSEDDRVKGSPHVFLPDGTDVHNPGISMHWEGEHGKGFPVVDRDEPTIYEDLLRRAAGQKEANVDESAVRQQAEAHGRATVAGDLKMAGADLDKGAYAAAGEVMKKLPADLTGSEVTDVRAEGDQWVVSINYTGASDSAVVESRWADSDGSPKIMDLRVV